MLASFEAWLNIVQSKLKRIFNQTINTINRFTTVNSNKIHIQKSGFHTSATINKGYIKPLKRKKLKSDNKDKTKRFDLLKPFSTMDIETMDFKGEQLPIAVSLSTINVQGKIKNKFFMINKLNLVGGLPDSVELVNEIDSM